MTKKIMIASTAVVALVLAGGLYVSGSFCGDQCALSAFVGVNEAVACGASKANAADGGSCSSHAKVIQANASGKSCTKEECVAWLMKNKGMTQADAEAAYANCTKTCAEAKTGVTAANATGATCGSKTLKANAKGSSCGSKAKAIQAGAKGSTCGSKAKAIQANASSAGCSATCASKATKASVSGAGCCPKTKAIQAKAGGCSSEQAVAWLMNHNGMTKAEAEGAYANCSKTKAAAEAGVLAANAGVDAPKTTDEVKSTAPDGAGD